ncbi:MAG: hypothetical protein MI784_15320 [Cytophagales bacterium]|nr:hypothetical protein [Cytophagales bacterium]
MIDVHDFEAIRPYRDHEVKEVISRLAGSEELRQATDLFLSKEEKEYVEEHIPHIETIKQFQDLIISFILANIFKRSTDGFTVENAEEVDFNQTHLFISNHRDIVLDSGFLNFYLNEKDFQTSEIAIGNNLLTNENVRDMVKLNKSFMVTRDVSARELLMHSKRLSNYIRSRITDNAASIWLAQAEGRAKDGNDRTHSGVLKMLNMSAKDKPLNNFSALNIQPFAISYEFDPCAGMKAKEAFVRDTAGQYTKAENEDNMSMMQGIVGYKGRVHLSFGKAVNTKIDRLASIGNANQFISSLAELIDSEIHRNYRLWPSNYISFDRLHKTSQFEDKYSKEDIEKFDRYLKEQIDSVEGKKEELSPYIIRMFACPVENFLNAEKN